MTRIQVVLPVLALALAACAPPQGPDVTQFIAPTKIETQSGPPPPDADGQCWGFIPGETRTELEEQTIEVEPAELAADGTEITPAIFRKASVPVERTDPGRAFARVCDDALTPELVEPLQRALSARGVYLGEITGVMDALTRDAVRRYQKDQGLDDDALSVAAARQLGLVAVDIPEPPTDPGPQVPDDPVTTPDPEPEPEPEPDAETATDPDTDS